MEAAGTGLLNPLLATVLRNAREAREAREAHGQRGATAAAQEGSKDTPTSRLDATTRGRQNLRLNEEEARQSTNTKLAIEALGHKLLLVETKVQTLNAALLEHGEGARPGPSVLAQLRQTLRDIKGEASQCRGEREQLAFRAAETSAPHTTFRDRLNIISDALDTLTSMMERGTLQTEELSSPNPSGLIPPTPPAGPYTATHQSSVSAGLGRAHLKRMELPQFSGSIEDYLEFRETWHLLVAETYQNPSLYLLQLKNHIPKEAKNMLRGVTVVEEAWAVLDSHYGDKNAAVATVTANLRHLKVSGTASHEKLESVAQGVHEVCGSRVSPSQRLRSDWKSCEQAAFLLH